MSALLRGSIATGVLSGALFLVVSALGLGFIFMFLPTLPLFYAGLGKQPEAAFFGGLLAAVITALFGSVALSFFFLIVFILPTSYMCLRAYKNEALGRMFLNLTACACAMMALVTWHYATQTGGIEQAISQQLQTEFSDIEGDYSTVIKQLTTHWAFLIFAMTIWLWNLTLYFHAWIACRLLRRSTPLLGVFSMPNWILSLLAIAALASLIGSPPMQFLGKLSFIALLFPYFMLGVSLMHATSKTWPSRGFLLFFIYLAIVAFFWPALVIAGWGFAYHIKHLSGTPTSSKS